MTETLNPEWPTVIICKSWREPEEVKQIYASLCEKLKFNTILVHSTSKLFEILATTEQKITAVFIDLDDIQQQLAQDSHACSVSEVMHTLECLVKSKQAQMPKWAVHFCECTDVNLITQVLCYDISFIVNRNDLQTAACRETVYRCVLAGTPYLGPHVLKLLSGAQAISSSVAMTHVTIFNTKTSALISHDLNSKLELYLPVKFQFTSSWCDLCHKLTDVDYTTHMIVVDAEELINFRYADLTDALITLDTISKLSGKNYNQSAQTPAQLYVKVGASTDMQLIKKLLKFRQVSGLIARGGDGFAYDEVKQSFLDSLQGKYHIPAKIQAQLDVNKKPKNTKNATSLKGGVALTDRQQQVLDMVCQKGNSNKMIANSLKVTESTVKVHLSTIMKKYGVKNRTQLAVEIKNTASGAKITQV